MVWNCSGMVRMAEKRLKTPQNDFLRSYDALTVPRSPINLGPHRPGMAATVSSVKTGFQAGIRCSDGTHGCHLGYRSSVKTGFWGRFGPFFGHSDHPRTNPDQSEKIDFLTCDTSGTPQVLISSFPLCHPYTPVPPPSRSPMPQLLDFHNLSGFV